MRFYYRITLALLLIFLFEDNVLGAPTRGKYMWVECKPDGKNANCVQNQGPWVSLPGPSDRLPPSAIKDIAQQKSDYIPQVQTEEPEEQSGEASGFWDPYANIPYEKESWMGDDALKVDTAEVKEPVTMEEESSGDDSNDIIPERKDHKLSADELREDNMLQ